MKLELDLNVNIDKTKFLINPTTENVTARPSSKVRKIKIGIKTNRTLKIYSVRS